MAEKTVLTRELYRQIKSKTREEMDTFIQNIYQSGFRDAGATSVDFDKLKEDISHIKGIGESRLEEIMKVIEKNMKEAENSK